MSERILTQGTEPRRQPRNWDAPAPRPLPGNEPIEGVRFRTVTPNDLATSNKADEITPDPTIDQDSNAANMSAADYLLDLNQELAGMQDSLAEKSKKLEGANTPDILTDLNQELAGMQDSLAEKQGKLQVAGYVGQAIAAGANANGKNVQQIGTNKIANFIGKIGIDPSNPESVAKDGWLIKKFTKKGKAEAIALKQYRQEKAAARLQEQQQQQAQEIALSEKEFVSDKDQAYEQAMFVEAGNAFEEAEPINSSITAAEKRAIAGYQEKDAIRERAKAAAEEVRLKANQEAEKILTEAENEAEIAALKAEADAQHMLDNVTTTGVESDPKTKKRRRFGSFFFRKNSK